MIQFSKKPDAEKETAAVDSAPKSPPVAATPASPPPSSPATSAPDTTDKSAPETEIDLEETIVVSKYSLTNILTLIDNIRSGDHSGLRGNRGVIIGGAVGVVVVVVSLIIYTAYRTIYPSYLISNAESAIIDKNYATAQSAINRAVDIAGPSEESTILLARTYLFLGKYDDAKNLLSNEDVSSSPELAYMLAISSYPENPDAAYDMIASIHAEEDSFATFYAAAAKAVFAMIEGDYIAANNLFPDETLVDFDDTLVQLHMIQLATFLWNYNNVIKAQTRSPLPFKYIKTSKSPNADIYYPIDTVGYDNIYVLPIGGDFIKWTIDNTSSALIYQMIKTLAQLKENDSVSPINYNDVSELESLALGTKFIVAYQKIISGELDKALEIYVAINQSTPNYYSLLYESMVIWQMSDGAAPSDEAWEKLRESVKSNPKNVQALNNLAFWEIYFGNPKKGRENILSAYEINNLHHSVLLNYVISNIIADKGDSQDSAIQIDSLFNKFPESETIVNTGVYIHLKANNTAKALSLLEKLRSIYPEEVAIAQQIAKIYEKSGQALLALSALKKALTKFPDNDKLIKQFIIYKIKNNELKEARQKLNALNLSDDDAFNLYTQALMISYKDKEKAVAIGSQALNQATHPLALDVALDLVRWYLNINNNEQARAIYKNISSSEKLSQYISDKELKALENRVRTANQETVNKNDFIKPEDTYNVYAKIDLAWTYSNLLQQSDAIQVLEGLLNQQINYPNPDILTALHSLYVKSDQPQKAGQLVSMIKATYGNVDQYLSTSSTQKQSQKIFTGSSEVLKKIDKAVSRNDYTTAISLYTFLIDLDQPLVTPRAISFQNRGALHMATKNYTDAVADFQHSLTLKDQLKPKEIDSITFNYINALVKNKNFNQAESKLQEIIAEQNNSANDLIYRKLYSGILSAKQTGVTKEVVDFYEASITKYPQETVFYTRLSAHYLKAANYSGSINTLSRGLTINPKSIRIRELLVEAHIQTGNVNEAQKQKEIIKQLKSSQ